MKLLLTISIIAVFPSMLFSQIKSCGTDIDNSNISRLQEYNKRWQNRSIESKEYGTTTFYVPVQLHVHRSDGGIGGISETDCLRAFDRLNDYYINASVHFYQVEAINYIDDDTYYDYDKSQMSDLDNDYGVTDVINIYVANTVTSSGSAICGHAQFPGGLDFVMQSISCMKNGSTLAHEVGHYMGLYHTHETSFGDEAVDGSDCATEGDLICDTPADPRLSGGSNFNSSGCIYYGTEVDENGDSYSPMVSNVISYASKECRVMYTEEQHAKILWTLENERTYLTWPAVLIEVDAYFYVKPIDDCYNVTAVEFYCASDGADSYLWDFGDGSIGSADESPSHPYGSPGVYDVTLTVMDFLGFTSTYSRSIAVGAVDLPYTNDFDNGASDLEDFNIVNSMKDYVELRTDAAESGVFGMMITGTESSSTSPNFKTPTTATAFDEFWNPYYKSTVSLCVNGVGYSSLVMDFDKRQIRTSNDNYTNLRVTVNGVQINNVISVETSDTDDPGFTNYSFDLSAYDGTVFTITLEGSHKYHADYGGVLDGTATMIDNLTIDGIFDPSQSGVEELSASAISVYPNPFTELFQIASSSEIEMTPKFFTLSGKDLSSQIEINRTSASAFSCDLSRLASGIYLVIVGDEFIRVVKK